MRRRIGLAVLVLTSMVSVATSRIVCHDARLPRQGTPDWDPNAPLLLGFSYDTPPHDTAGLLSRIHLAPADGGAVELVAASHSNTLVLCPVGGLAPDTDYVWDVGALGSDSPNHVGVPDFDRTGVRRFHTAATSALVAAANERDCVRLAERVSPPFTCADTGDTGIQDDTGDTGIQDDTDDTDDTDDADGDTE